MANIKLNLPAEPFSGQIVTFTAPCNCDEVSDGLVINGETYTVCDAMGECVTGKGGAWCAGAQISVVLDCESKKAYIQNAAGGGGFVTFTEDNPPASRSNGTLYGLVLADYREVN